MSERLEDIPYKTYHLWMNKVNTLNRSWGDCMSFVVLLFFFLPLSKLVWNQIQKNNIFTKIGVLIVCILYIFYILLDFVYYYKVSHGFILVFYCIPTLLERLLYNQMQILQIDAGCFSQTLPVPYHLIGLVLGNKARVYQSEIECTTWKIR